MVSAKYQVLIIFQLKALSFVFDSKNTFVVHRVFLGVGHQTAKRLQALGLVSVKDLQLFPLNDLVREFGDPSAQRLKNLANGVDDLPVTPTGPPQVG